MNPKFKVIKKAFPKIIFDVSLENHTTFRLGGKAKYFLEVKTNEELILALKKIKKNKIPFFVLGGGSKMLVSDKGFKGLLIKTKNSNLVFRKNKIYAGSGTNLERLMNIATEKGLTGLEWAAGIPGTVGGAARGNAGAWGFSMKDVVENVLAFDVNKNKSVTFRNKDCKFGYRNSIFKREKNLIIISCRVKLKKGNKKIIKEKIKEYLDYRKKNHPLEFPSAGSVFENVYIKGINKEDKIPAGKIIADCGLAGQRMGNVKISEKHSNFIINLGQGKASDVKKLIELVKKKVKKKFKIDLREELQYLD